MSKPHEVVAPAAQGSPSGGCKDDIEQDISALAEVLVKIGTGDFEARAERSFDGSPIDVLTFLVNNMAEEIQDLFVQLEQKNAMLEAKANDQAVAERTAFSTLTAGVAHELNNPLAFTSGNLEFVHMELEQLLEDGDTERVPELLQALSEASQGVDRAARIASDLKRLSPSVEMRFTAVDVARVIDSALALIRNTASHRGRLRCTIEPLPPIWADQGRIGQVIINLIQNALHALPEGRAYEDNLVEIIATRYSESMVSIEVRDNGVGIAPENLRRIFESFYTTRPLGKGTGLGLSLSKRMVTDHGGRIEVDSELGRGTTFRVIIPIAETLP